LAGEAFTPVPAADIERDCAWDPQRFSPPEDKIKLKNYIDQKQIAEYVVGFNDCPSWRIISKKNPKKNRFCPRACLGGKASMKKKNLLLGSEGVHRRQRIRISNEIA